MAAKKKKSTVNKAGNYTKPTMRKNLFNKIKAGTKGGRAAMGIKPDTNRIARADGKKDQRKD